MDTKDPTVLFYEQEKPLAPRTPEDPVAPSTYWCQPENITILDANKEQLFKDVKFYLKALNVPVFRLEVCTSPHNRQVLLRGYLRTNTGKQMNDSFDGINACLKKHGLVTQPAPEMIQ